MLALLIAALVQAEPAALQEPIVTRQHHIMLDGRRLDYTSRAGRIPIRDNETGEVHAWMFFVAYSRVPEQTGRPLTFAWNGGPGSNAALIQLRGIGPRRFAANGALVDNDGTWLDRTDLVFVDPVGTGYSRVTKQEYGAEFYQTRGDAESVAEFIRVYRDRFERWSSPLFLAGESYGVTRAAGVSEVLGRRGIPLQGVVLIGLKTPLMDVPDHVERALRVPSWTAAAWHHTRLAPSLQGDFDATFRRSAAWATDTLAPALARSGEKTALLQELSTWTGVPVAAFDSSAFELSYYGFARQLLKEQGKRLGHYDVRLTGPIESEPGPYDPTRDPSLVNYFPANGVLRYIQSELGYRNDLMYMGPFGGAWPPSDRFRGDWMSVKWKWSRSEVPDSTGKLDPPDLPLPRAMATNPKLRVFATCGYYDLVCDVALNEWIVRQLPDSLRSRVVLKPYHGGHAIYMDDRVRAELRRDVAAFLGSGTPAQ